MEVVHVRCAGLDVHKKKILACIRVVDQTGAIERQVKTFGTTTGNLVVLSDWLRACAVTMWPWRAPASSGSPSTPFLKVLSPCS